MATKTLLGTSQPVAQVETWTVGGAFALGQVYTITCNRKTVSYTAASPDAANADAAAGLFAALAASGLFEFLEIAFTYTAGNAFITFTAATAGVPFTVTGAATGTGTLTKSAVTASSGPRHYDDPNNWDAGSIPVNGDDVVIPFGVGPVLYGLSQTGVTPNSVKIYAQAVGLPDVNPLGYTEYRPTALTYAGCATNQIGDPQYQPPTIVRLNMTAGPASTYTIDTGDAGTAGPAAGPPVVLIQTGTAHAHVLRGISGSVGLAFEPGTVCRFDTLTFGTAGPGGYRGAGDADCRVTIGAGAVLTGATAELHGGAVDCRAALATLNVRALKKADAVWLQRDAAVTTILNTGGTVDYRAAANITTATFTAAESVFDLSGGVGSLTVGTLSMTGGAAVIDPEKRVTSLSGTLDRASLAASDFGDTMTLTRA